MLSYKQYMHYLDEARKPSLAATSKVSSDDKGKLFELLLAHHMSHTDDSKKRLPSHHRSENEDYAGTPQQVHDRLRGKIGEQAYNELHEHAKATADAVKDHLGRQGLLGGSSGHHITDVSWTSNADTKNKAGDHEKTTGIKDVNSNADIIATTKNAAGETNYIPISAKYGQQKPNYKNAGLDALETLAGHPKGTYTSILKHHDAKMAELGYIGTRDQRHAQYKQDKKSEDPEIQARVTDAEASSLESRRRMARLHERGLSRDQHNPELQDAFLRRHIASQASSSTVYPHIVAHGHVQADGSVSPTINNAADLVEKHLSKYSNLHIRPSTGVTAKIWGTHKQTGKPEVVATQTFKASSGPNKGMAGAFGLG
jgi:hypothetical protein